jgi:hypothetical protein
MNEFLFADNQQEYLAAKFHINETQLTQASHLAFLKIQSWKFAIKTPSVGNRFRDEAADMLTHSFFNFLKNTELLDQVGYASQPLN